MIRRLKGLVYDGEDNWPASRSRLKQKLVSVFENFAIAAWRQRVKIVKATLMEKLQTERISGLPRLAFAWAPASFEAFF